MGYAEDDIVEAGVAVRSEKGRVYDRFRNRLMIPIYDGRGLPVGFGARALDPDDNPKYLNSPQTPLFDKGALLFGLHHARRAIRESETAVIVEGYMDAIQAHQAGFANVVAQMGTALTEPQSPLAALCEDHSGARLGCRRAERHIACLEARQPCRPISAVGWRLTYAFCKFPTPDPTTSSARRQKTGNVQRCRAGGRLRDRD
jgi:hypothetical protein